MAFRSPCAGVLYQTTEAPQPQGWLFGRPGLHQVDLEFCHPVIVFLRVDQHLLNSPGTFIFRGNDVGVAQISRIWIQADVFVLQAIFG